MKNVYFVTDVESTGPDYVEHDMYQFACVPVLSNGSVLPKGIKYDVELRSYDPKNHDEATLKFLHDDLGITLESLKRRTTAISAFDAMFAFNHLIQDVLSSVDAEKPIFIADNLAFDWGYTHVNFFRHLGKNPFGHSGWNIPCLSLGFYGSRGAWENYRTKAHTHDALDDTSGNAGAFAKMVRDGLKI